MSKVHNNLKSSNDLNLLNETKKTNESKFSDLFRNYDPKTNTYRLKSIHDLDDWEWDD